jgi:uncharacterized damage-inducible protein DinB
MKPFFLKQFEYEAWANQMILEALQKTDKPEERSLFLFSHLLSSHSMWLSRVKGAPLTATIFQERTLKECEDLMAENTEGWQAYLATMAEEDFERVIRFTMPTDGSSRMVKVTDALAHLFNHSAYHRGQIVARLKGLIDPLPLTTYIAFASQLEEVAAS